MDTISAADTGWILTSSALVLLMTPGLAFFYGGLVRGQSVLNTMMMSVSERTRELGTLRALGWTGRRVLGVIVVEGSFISIAGGLLGMGFGFLGTELLLTFFSRGYLVASYLPQTFLHGFLLALIVGLLGSLYPAMKASALQPAEALRYE